MKNRKQKILQKESHQSIQVNSKKLPNPNPKNDQTWATKVQHAPPEKKKKIARLRLSCDSYCTTVDTTVTTTVTTNVTTTVTPVKKSKTPVKK